MNNRKIGIIISYANTILNMLCGLFLTSYLIRRLGQTDYGIYQTICSFANYLVILEFGVGTVITRNIVRCRTNRYEGKIQKNVSTVLTISVILSALILVASVVFYFAIPLLYSSTLDKTQIVYAKKIFTFEAVYLIISFFSNVPRGILLGFEQYAITPIVSIIRIVIRTATLILLIFYIPSAIIIVYVDVAISILVLAFDIWYCISKLHVRFTIMKFDKGIFLDALPLCLAIFIQCIVNQANSNVDKFILGIKASPESVTIYSVSLYIYSMFSSLTTIPISMYAPKVIEQVEKGIAGRELEDRLIPPSRIIVLVGSVIVFGFFSVGKQFLTILYGESYMIAWLIALLLMCPMLLNMSNGILINVLNAKNLRIARSYVLMITTIANIVLTFLWIEQWGILGASAATAVCTIVGQITLMNIYYCKKLDVDVLYMYKKTFKGILGYQIIASVLAYLLARQFANSIVAFVVGGCIYLTIFGILFFAKGATDDEKKIINQIKGTSKNLPNILKKLTISFFRR